MSLRICQRCLYGDDHPLGLILDKEGICSGCRVHEEKDFLEWDDRWRKLEKLVSEYKSSEKGNYDCIVPVTGANDSFYIVYLVKVLLKLNPLLVTYNKYYNTPLGVKNLANLRMKFNCDILYQNVNPISVKNITRTTLRKFGSVYWHCLAGHTVFPVQTAVRLKIPLIIWGAHQGIEQVGMYSHEHEVEMTRRYRKDHDLMGYEPEDIIDLYDGTKERDVWQYMYPDDLSLSRVGVRGVYLGNYVRWDPKAQHELMIEKYGYKSSKFSRTFDTYDYVDCFVYMGIHDLLKLFKNGYSKVTDHASREIRFGRLSRNQALTLVKKHELEPAKYLNSFCDWINMDSRSLDFVLSFWKSNKYWKGDTFLNSVFKGWSSFTNNSDFLSEQLFQANSSLEDNKSDKFITIGKGFDN